MQIRKPTLLEIEKAANIINDAEPDEAEREGVSIGEVNAAIAILEAYQVGSEDQILVVTTDRGKCHSVSNEGIRPHGFDLTNNTVALLLLALKEAGYDV